MSHLPASCARFDELLMASVERTLDGPEHAEYDAHLGHLASRNPDYRNRTFGEVEPDLRKGWSSDPKYGSWDAVRSYANEGFTRGRSALGRAGEKVANTADDLKDRVDGNPASRPGIDPTDRPGRSA